MSFLEHLKTTYPRLNELPSLEQQLHFFVSDFHLRLPSSVFARIEKGIGAIVEYAHSPEYLKILLEKATEHEKKILSADSAQKSALNAFDFHYNQETDQLSLIEINTNASAYLVAANLYEYKKKPAIQVDPIGDLMASFETEAELFGWNGRTFPVLIIDEDIKNQKMFFEFLMYQSAFEAHGWRSEVREFSAVGEQDVGALIYNRYCDFLLEKPESKILLQQFLAKKNLFTPSPKEYLLMAAKDRLEDFATAGISEVLIPSKRFTDFPSADAIWESRKDHYFKPRRMYGGKAVFRGSSISRKRFEELDHNEYLVQENRPPGTVDEWKFDLRVYTYGSKIQLVISRFFQGQLLNFSTAEGGLATVEFTDKSKIAVEKS